MAAKDPDYSFFKSFKDYKNYEKEMKMKILSGNDNPTCATYSWDSKKFGNDSAINICIQFKILCDVIEKRKDPPNLSKIDDKDFSYINYWLNDLSRNNSSSNNLTLKEFQIKMDGIEDIFTTVKLDEKLYHIKDEDFKNMNLLSDLYDNQGKIFQFTSKIKGQIITCIDHFQEFISTYEKGIIQCPHDDTSFCKALKHFKEEYENYVFGQYGASNKCIDKDLLKLPTYKDISAGDKVTVVGTILGPSFVSLFASIFLYKFTPLGQWIRSKMRTSKGIHSKLYEENDQLLLNTLGTENINSDYNEFSISYDSIVNS
ncbi:PIR protein [Plasmodium ovale]|uniref:PIR protein n=1 Tax=Plasmodium ovale TaxID=36330 RepID=A0A1D3JBR6_PLAOA|nr:PIR protein [Plasmodium ovale]